jgi:hypothetical protein
LKSNKNIIIAKMIKEDLFFIHILQKNHFIIAKMFEEEMNSPLKEEMEK